ncbi:MAG TPA: alpha-L-fucosidase [Opitutaceae bacterium]|nr:alpha-L-fucosidase [Opitutaceae bacterium]
MRTPNLLSLCTFMLTGLTITPPLSAVSDPKDNPAERTAPLPAAAPLTHDQRIAWFREAKFGLFIHWGLYAVPAGEWHGKPIPGLGEWIMHNAPIPVKDYELLAKQFDPRHFDADAIAQFAHDVGMKYVVITAKHHDGFAMYHSTVSPYNVYDATPFHRDPIKELSEACARHGLRFGVYYSQTQDWHEPNGMGNITDFGPDKDKDFAAYLHAKAEPQVKELLTHYGPLCLIWFDTPNVGDKMTPELANGLANMVRALQPACLIDGRLGTEGDYVSTGDNAIPNLGEKGDWETPATVNHTWGFKKDDTDWKSPGEIVFKLMDIVSKGGNYLLNVGPTADGVIPKECRNNLLTVGRWLKINGEAVYGASRSPFGAEFGEYSADLKDTNGKAVFLPLNAWRCTAKPGKLYFTMFTFPRMKDPDGTQYTLFELPAFKSTIKKVYALADPAQNSLPIETMEGKRVVKLPRNPIDPMATVLCVEIEGDQVRL